MFDGEDTTMTAPIEPTAAPAEDTAMSEATDHTPATDATDAPVQE